jgi:hypothetical protein
MSGQKMLEKGGIGGKSQTHRSVRVNNSDLRGTVFQCTFEHMPRYRITKEVPEALNYRDGRLFFHDYYAGGKEWVWYVRRETVQHRSVNLCVAEGADKLAELRKRGLTVAKGSTADQVLQSLVRKGYAERLPE